jgi:hypothetical protein
MMRGSEWITMVMMEMVLILVMVIGGAVLNSARELVGV